MDVVTHVNEHNMCLKMTYPMSDIWLLSMKN